MFKKVLVAYDAEKQSQKVLGFAIDLVKGTDAQVFIVTSLKVPDRALLEISLSNDDNMLDVEKSAFAYYEKKQEAVVTELEKNGISTQVALLFGNPGEAIVEFSEKENFDLIIMGSSNRGFIRRALLGSVSSYVINNAVCAVTIVKD